MANRPNLVTLYFWPLVPGQGQGPMISFPGYIDSFSDSYQPQWDGQKDIGRADAKYLYGQFQRSVNLTFKVVILNAAEKDLWLSSLNSLIACTYPVYKMGLGYNGVFVKFKIAQLLQSSGIIESLDYSVDVNIPWIEGVPTIYNVSMNINVIEDEKPRYRRLTHRPIMGGTSYQQGKPTQ